MLGAFPGAPEPLAAGHVIRLIGAARRHKKWVKLSAFWENKLSIVREIALLANFADSTECVLR